MIDLLIDATLGTLAVLAVLGALYLCLRDG